MVPGRDPFARRTLILNASGEPLHIADARRALLLVLDQTADVVSESSTVVHSQHAAFNLPSIIQLRRYVNAPRIGRGIPLTTRTVVARDRGRCAYCGQFNATEMEHIIPKAQGGPHTWENVVAACHDCNHRKADRRPEEAGMPLRFQPTRPRGAYARLLLYAVEPDWEPYLLKAA